MNFIVNYSIEKDMIPYLNVIWRMQYKSFGRDNLRERLLSSKPEQFQKDIKKAKTEEDAKKVVTSYLETRFKARKTEIDKKIYDIQMSIDQNKVFILDTLENTFNKKFPFDEISIYLTTAGICPYNFEERWFMVYSNADTQRVVGVATHELNHFMFFYYYLNDLQERGLDKYKLMVLKEALPVLTGDKGGKKPDAKELEDFLRLLKGKQMDEIIELAINSEAFKNIHSSS